MANARQIYQLQEMDQALEALQAQMKALEAHVGDRSQLDSALKGIEEKRARVRELLLKQRAQDRELVSLRSRLREIEGQLYGGSVTNPRDLEGLQREQGAVKEQVERMEEALLEMMVSLEEAQTSLAREEARAPSVEKAWHEEQDRLVKQVAQLRSEIEAQTSEKAVLAGALTPQEVSLYSRLRTTRGGSAVAMVERAVCGGCRVSLPTHMVQRARLGRELVFCPSCGRILLVN